MADAVVTGALLFYGGFPLGFPNREAEREAQAFAAAGYAVHYAPGVALQDPRPSHLARVAALGVARLRQTPGRVADSGGVAPLALLVAPPRRTRLLRRMNAAWLARQLRSAIGDTRDAVAWVRFPSPELVAALPLIRPATVVYETVDGLHETPGVAGTRWADVLLAAEAALVDQAAAVVATSAPLAERWSGRHPRVEVVPHGVELFPWRPRAPIAGRPLVLGFVGTLDFRIDLEVLHALATHRADWRIVLRGPTGPGFDAKSLQALPNVEIGGPVARAQLGTVLDGFDVGLMPYRAIAHYRYANVVKNLELMAAGRPAVARPTPALAVPDGVYLADGPEEFVAACERALAEDDEDRARERRKIAERHTLAERHARLVDLLAELRES